MLDTEDFKNCVKTYVELHDEIASSSKHLSELRKKKEAIGELIMEFMKHKGIDECELQDNGGKLIRKESKRTETLKKEHILQELMHLVNHDNSRAETVLSNIYNKRNVEVTERLTRTKR